nr:DUF2948 family protein [Sandaracinobacteroides sayramensis]
MRAEEPDDLILVSACVQDMAILAHDIAWQPRQQRLALIGNRFRWEDAARGPQKGGAATRIRSALRFDYVKSVQRRNWPAAADAVLPLLSITFDGGEADGGEADGGEAEAEEAALLLSFGGGAALRLTQEVLDATLEDVSGPWGAAAIPDHDAD